MSAQTKIQWCDSTINFWSGCTKVSAGCANCYAETLAKRFRAFGGWGPGKSRKLHRSAFVEARRLNLRPWVCGCGGTSLPDNCGERCPMCGTPLHRRRIFSLSMGDWLDPEVPADWLVQMLDTIRECDEVEWILCTKRPHLFGARMEEALTAADDAELSEWLQNWTGGLWPEHVTILASVEDQAAAEQRIPALLSIPARWRGLSLEPLLGPVNLTRIETDEGPTYNALTGEWSGDSDWLGAMLNWLIIGGESGPGARPCDVAWIRSLVQQGRAAGVPVFVKQLGSKPYQSPDTRDGTGHQLDIRDRSGADPLEWPDDICVREWPGERIEQAQNEAVGGRGA